MFRSALLPTFRSVSQRLDGGKFMSVAFRSSGKVKNFSEIKGFGFIVPSDGSVEVFVHQSSIQKDGFRSLRIGEEVEYDLEVDPSNEAKRQARNVTGPNGVPVLGADRSFGNRGEPRGSRENRGTSERRPRY